MVCPRCSLANPAAARVCARCGEAAPRPLRLVFESAPDGGPRAAPVLDRELGLDRRGRGVRALDSFAPPLRIRAPVPAWSRPRSRESGPYAHPPRMYRGPIVAPAGRAEPLPSEVQAAPTNPQWLVAPLGDEGRSSADPAPGVPSHGARAAAWLVDAALSLAMAAAACAAAAMAMGGRYVRPILERGFDYVLDGVVVGRGVGFAVLGFAVVAGATLATLSHALAGTTPGKALCGLRLATRSGQKPSFGACAARSAAAALSVLPFGLGIAWALFDPERRTLHDRLLGTLVVPVARAAASRPAGHDEPITDAADEDVVLLAEDEPAPEAQVPPSPQEPEVGPLRPDVSGAVTQIDLFVSDSHPPAAAAGTR